MNGQIVSGFMLVLCIMWIPAFMVAAVCKVSSQRRASVRLTIAYAVVCGGLVYLHFTLGRIGGMGPSPERDTADTLAIIIPVWLISGIWMIHFMKMYLARQHGWWGATKVEKPEKSYGFPVIPRDENKPPV